MANNIYKDDSIQSLDPREFTRLRPAVYAGSTEYSTQLLIEVVSNAVDEFKIGHGDTIKVDITKDNLYIVEDNAQGFPVNSKREDGKTVLEAACSVLNTSGKYTDDGVYAGTSLGVNGIGLKLATFLSSSMEAMTWRDGKYEHLWFKDGIFQKRDCGDWKNLEKPTGTLIQWRPDPQFFEHPEVDMKVIKSLFKVITCLCQGLTIELNNNGEKTTYYSRNGLSDLVDEATKGKELIKNRFAASIINGKNKMNMLMTYTSNYSSTIVPYVNVGLTESGPHITQTKTILTREFNKFFRDKGWLKEKDENLSGEDLQEGMYLILDITAPGVAYDAQTKSRVSKLDMKPFTADITTSIQSWCAANEKDAKIIADRALNARKARDAARKARDAARGIQTKDKKKKILNLPTKLVDCWSKKRLDCELMICEGDSAASGLVEARNAEFTAVFPVRGKLIACLKNSAEKIFANQEIVNLIKAIGLDLDPKTNKLIYDEKKLRYGRIYLAMDGDSDGSNIRNLLIEMFWWLCPELVCRGHVYTTMPPLFRITTKKNEYIYLKDDKALEEYKAKHKGEKYLVNRNKGLGEQDASELFEALLNPETRNVAQLVVPDVSKADNLVQILMGTLVPPRREYLLAHEEEANEDE